MALVIVCDGCSQQKPLQIGFFTAAVPNAASLQLHACSSACKAVVETAHNVTMTPC